MLHLEELEKQNQTRYKVGSEREETKAEISTEEKKASEKRLSNKQHQNRAEFLKIKTMNLNLD